MTCGTCGVRIAPPLVWTSWSDAQKHPSKVPGTRTQVQGTRDSRAKLRSLALHLHSTANLHYTPLSGRQPEEQAVSLGLVACTEVPPFFNLVFLWYYSRNAAQLVGKDGASRKPEEQATYRRVHTIYARWS